MWVSQKMARGQAQSGAQKGVVTDSAAGQVEFLGAVQLGKMQVVGPFGVVSVPVFGAEVLAMPVGDGYVCAGVFPKNADVHPGEVLLFSQGGARVHLKNNGEVVINGQTFAAQSGT